MMPKPIENHQESKDNMFAVFADSAVDAIITISEMGIVKSFNPAAESLFQYTAGEIIGKNVNVLMPSPYTEEHDTYLNNYLTTGQRKIIGTGREVEALCKDKTRVPIFLSVSEVKQGGQRIFIGVVRDLSEIKQKETELQLAIDQATFISEGDFTREVIPKDEEDELGIALSKMTKTLNNLQNIMEQVSSGDYKVQVEVKGEKDKLSRVINTMIANFCSIREDSAKEDWVKTGQSGVAESMGGCQNILELTRSIITYLAKYLDAQVGVFYVVDKDDTFKLSSSYAFSERKHIMNTIKPGEGLVGQAVLEKEIIVLEDVPENYIQVSSALGDTPPHNIIVIPILIESVVVGVMELGTLETFNEAQLELIKRVTHSIALAIIASKEKDAAKSVIEESQLQAEELQSQAEEMEAQQEELRVANEQLKQQTTNKTLNHGADQKKQD
jgi:PAS domain S-box-containing protein